jgi:hypothetical protein
MAKISKSIIEKQNRMQAYSEDPKKCLHCDTSISYEYRRNKFCGSVCAATFSQKAGPNRKRSRFCKVCDGPRPKGFTVYCSHECMETDRRQTSLQKLDDGSLIYRATIKKILVKERGWCCEVCQTKEWLKQPIPLELDHIDGDAGNNLPSNLRLICPNCHALTPTAKGRNKGFGRKTRGITRG